MWNELREYNAVDLLLWRAILWMNKRRVITLNKQTLLVRGGWNDGNSNCPVIFCGIDMWIPSHRAHGW